MLRANLMVTQDQRRAATRGAILKAARAIFGDQGFAATTVDQIAAAAGVAKGAVYHHFAAKEALFEAVFDAVSGDLVREVGAAAAGANDALAAMTAGARAYFAACSEGPTGRIILRDGPAVLGWERWREIDRAHFAGRFPAALAAAMDAGIVPRQPVEPLGALLLGAVTEAAMACAASDDVPTAGAAHLRALETLLEGLRVR